MWWGIGFGGLLYIVLLATLGVMTLRKGQLGDVHPRALSPALLADRRRDPAYDGTGGLGTSTDQISRSRIRTSLRT